MEYPFKAIPTVYGDVRFRSRLEARWAAFFDLCHWSWEYEPLDLEGWAPDFSIKSWDNKRRMLCEVKPLSIASDKHEIYETYAKAFLKNEDAPSTYLFGDGPEFTCFPPIGSQNEMSVCLEAYFFEGERRLCGVQMRHMQYRALNTASPHYQERDPQKLWREAGNRVQWKGRRG